MASAGAIRAGRAFVEVFLDRSKFDKGIQGMGGALRGVGRGIFGFGAGIAGIGAAITGGLLATIPAASDAEQSLARFNAVFGEQSGDAGKFADDLAKQLGRSPTDIKNAMSSFQSIFQGLGFDPSKSLGLTKLAEQMRLDFAAFAKIDEGEARGRLISALSGSAEVLDQWGINIRAAALEQELMAMGINKTAQQATEQEKTLARLSIIYKTMGRNGSIGAAARATGTWAGQMNILKSSWQTFKEEAGKGVIDVLLPFLKLANQIATPIVAWVKANKTLVGILFLTSLGITAVGAAIMGLGGLFIFASAAIAAVGTAITFLLSPLGLFLAGAVVTFGFVALNLSLLAAAVAAPIAAFFAFTDAGRSMWGKIVMYLGAIWHETSRVFGGIFAALSQGKFAAAANIAWLGVKLAFAEGGLAIVNGFMYTIDTLGTFWEGGLMGMMDLFMQFVRFFLKTSMQMAQGMADLMMGNTQAALKAFSAISGPQLEGVNFLAQLIGDPAKTLGDLRDKTRMELDAALASLEVPAAEAQEDAKKSLAGAQEAAKAVNTIADTRGTFNALAASRAFGFAAGGKDKGATDETLQDTNGLLEQILQQQPLVLGGA